KMILPFLLGGQYPGMGGQYDPEQGGQYDPEFAINELSDYCH
ncbi:MAG: hypothetical protein FD155_3358, partial [Bacteroidetes bacterium]